MAISNQDVRDALVARGVPEDKVETFDESELDEIRKSLPVDMTTAELEGFIDTGDLGSSDEETKQLAEEFVKGVRACKKGFDEDDLDDEDDDEDDLDEDEDDLGDEDDEEDDDDGKNISSADVKAAAKKLFGDDDEEEDDEEDASPIRKALAEAAEFDDDGYVDLDVEGLAKGLTEAVTGMVQGKIAKLTKAVNALSAKVEELENLPRGRALPYQIKKGVGDGDLQPAEITDVLLTAQIEGIIRSDETATFTKALRGGSETWAPYAARYEEIKAQVGGTPE